jgi:hypothetical protein
VCTSLLALPLARFLKAQNMSSTDVTHRIITLSHGLCGRLVTMLAYVSLDTCVFISWMGADCRQRLGIVWLQCNASGAAAQKFMQTLSRECMVVADPLGMYGFTVEWSGR